MTERDQVPEQTYTYAAVEAALGKAFDADEKTLPGLRARINGLQRNGLVPESPGRGKVIRYKVIDVYRWGVALSLSSFGMPPRIVAKILSKRFTDIPFNEIDVRLAENKPYRLFMINFPFMFYDFYENQEDPIAFTFVWEEQIGKTMFFEDFLGGEGLSLGIVDLTQLKLRIDSAFS